MPNICSVPATPDHYTVLQVHPSADQAVIEAAYRQLMKKHHPDVAGLNAHLAAVHHQRAKVINHAHSVLGDPVARRRYDTTRTFDDRAAASPADASFESYDSAPADEAPAVLVEDDESMVLAVLCSPITALAAAYYRLPGPQEWERGHRQELLATCWLPVLGVAAFALATGRLAPWVGTSLPQVLLAWGLLAIFLLPSWSSLPRLGMASVPSLLLMSGIGDGLLHQTSAPAWLAWIVLGAVSLVLSARLYLFAVLPTLGACWLLARLG